MTTLLKRHAPGADHSATVQVSGIPFIVSDIGTRLFAPRELYRAQKFDAAYRFAVAGPVGKPVSKQKQIHGDGTAVLPQLAAAVVACNRPT